mgnify:CR=1 FL=1
MLWAPWLPPKNNTTGKSCFNFISCFKLYFCSSLNLFEFTFVGVPVTTIFLAFEILSFASCKQLGTYNVCVALPRSHPLAKKEKLSITDLYNEKLLCVSSGDCLNIDDFRKYMQTFYPYIILEDVGYFYDLDTFNRCEEEGCLLLTLDAWDNIHPSLITIPVDWAYKMPYGLLYKKNPSKQKDCLKEIDKYVK